MLGVSTCINVGQFLFLARLLYSYHSEQGIQLPPTYKWMESFFSKFMRWQLPRPVIIDE
jgi:hypothetical protein